MIIGFSNTIKRLAVIGLAGASYNPFIYFQF